jgi:hypothetical protein
MIGPIRDFVDRLLGRGEAGIAVPSFDGALKPNQRLADAEVVHESLAAEDLATDGASLYLADGAKLMRLDGAAATLIRAFEAPITALACMPGGGVAVALAGREVRVFAAPVAAEPIAVLADPAMNAVNALSPTPDGALIATDGSTNHEVDDWARDLLERGRSGRVFRLEPGSREVRVIASGLRYAFGVCASEHSALVSESWRHRVLRLEKGSEPRPVLDNLPVYPSRLSPASGGGYWLTAFAARTQLIEFVLRESTYRKRMMAEIDPSLWIAPRLRSGDSFMEPTQGAHLKTMGVIKPWAPPRSYGLVIRLNAEGTPIHSIHSRVDGVNHGVVAAVELGGALYMLAKGPGRVLKLPVAGLEKEVAA